MIGRDAYTSSRTYSSYRRAPVCLLKERKTKQPSCRPGNSKFRPASSSVDSVSNLRTSPPPPPSPFPLHTRICVYLYIYRGGGGGKGERMGWKKGRGHGRVFNASDPTMEDSGSEDRARHNVPLTCLYSCTERERL